MTLLKLSTLCLCIWSLLCMILFLCCSWWHIFLQGVLLRAFYLYPSFFVSLQVFLRLLMKDLALLLFSLVLSDNWWRCSFFRVNLLIRRKTFVFLVHNLELIVEVNYYFAWLVLLGTITSCNCLCSLMACPLHLLRIILIRTMILILYFRDDYRLLNFRWLLLLWWLWLYTKTIQEQL